MIHRREVMTFSDCTLQEILGAVREEASKYGLVEGLYQTHLETHNGRWDDNSPYTSVTLEVPFTPEELEEHNRQQAKDEAGRVKLRESNDRALYQQLKARFE